MSAIAEKLTSLLDSVLRPEPSPGRPDWLRDEDEKHRAKELEKLPKPSSWGDVEARSQRLAQDAAALAEERARLLALGQEAAGLRNRVLALEQQLGRGQATIALNEQRLAESQEHARSFFGHAREHEVSAGYIVKARDLHLILSEMKTFARDLEAELTEARKELQAFRAKHGISE